jgi:hypothetical protein
VPENGRAARRCAGDADPRRLEPGRAKAIAELHPAEAPTSSRRELGRLSPNQIRKIGRITRLDGRARLKNEAR